MASTKQVLRHVVLFKFKENTSTADITQLENEFRTLATVKVSQVKEYEWGTNVSKENLNHGYTHCFVLTFANQQDLDVYLDHEDHVAFVNILKPHLAEATVIDFFATS
jgi:predicted nucleic acid-binding protein